MLGGYTGFLGMVSELGMSGAGIRRGHYQLREFRPGAELEQHRYHWAFGGLRLLHAEPVSVALRIPLSARQLFEVRVWNFTC